jgi:hypothetical protein
MARRPLIRPWIEEDDATLLALDRQGKPLALIATRLRRTTTAVYHRRKLLQSEADGGRGEGRPRQHARP